MYSSKIECGIASLLERQENLKKTLDNLYDQFDRFHIVLNGYEKVPSFLEDKKIKTYLFERNQGAKMKYYKVEQCKGYYFSCDDDLIYPKNYVRQYMDRFVQHNSRVVVAAHGGNIKPFVRERVLKDRGRFDDVVPKDRFIMMGGTGVMAFYQPFFNLSFEDVGYKNMVDVSVFHKTQKEKIPVLLIKHPKDWIVYQEDVGKKFNIYRQKRNSRAIKNTFRDRLNLIQRPQIYEL